MQFPGYFAIYGTGEIHAPILQIIRQRSRLPFASARRPFFLRYSCFVSAILFQTQLHSFRFVQGTLGDIHLPGVEGRRSSRHVNEHRPLATLLRGLLRSRINVASRWFQMSHDASPQSTLERISWPPCFAHRPLLTMIQFSSLLARVTFSSAGRLMAEVFCIRLGKFLKLAFDKPMPNMAIMDYSSIYII
jgi:hypothetical protein